MTNFLKQDMPDFQVAISKVKSGISKQKEIFSISKLI